MMQTDPGSECLTTVPWRFLSRHDTLFTRDTHVGITYFSEATISSRLRVPREGLIPCSRELCRNPASLKLSEALSSSSSVPASRFSRRSPASGTAFVCLLRAVIRGKSAAAAASERDAMQRRRKRGHVNEKKGGGGRKEDEVKGRKGE